LWNFLQDQLAGADAERIDDHIGGCPACQRALDRLVGSLPGRWLPDPEGAKADPAAGDPQAAVARPAPGAGGADPRVDDDLPEGGEDDPNALFPPERPQTIGRYRVIRPLGRGGFGRVYLAHDDDLDRQVAIKVPNPERMTRPADIASFLAEGRLLARLDHPHIVLVFDAGRTEAGVGFVVSKLIEGSDLATRIGQGRPSFQEAAELIASLAEALHHAHTHGLVHRDVKPANILIDRTGRAYLADFGLALKDEDFGTGKGFAGTPAYMSPEQARGEGHRVDGRSDLFSLGLVLYELLTGRRAFRGDSWRTLIEQIIRAEVRPPRQIDDAIPRELERICLKAVSKRAPERYTTGRDMAEDLRHFLQAEAAGFTPIAPVPVSPPPGSTHEATPTPAPGRLDSAPQSVQVVPKGLRSFDQHDADFFLELLPGARDRDGLPESLRFWKTRIESTDPDSTFRVGLIYGPSGCGKSSLVKAGLLPRLGKHVRPVYIEATAGETEPRLLRGLRKVCPEVDAQLELVAAAAAVRRGYVVPPGLKVLLVLDQFEQWLFARRGEEDTELIATLRQCDGAHVQAIVMVRDDFWLAASRFMHDLEIRLVEGENSGLVDLFDPLHARKVLGSFGRAYGVLPARPANPTPEQQAFLDQAVAGLAQDGKIISVRLALFAEMVKGKPWTPATLREVGGTEGVGVTFLEETFGAATAPPEHRLHQNAAQAVLKALLPQSGTEIKGEMRSESELRAASGYASRPRDFEDLVRILDPELRLITPTDPDGAPEEGQAVRPASHRYYQLTHDYLVHALRDWLTRKQRETRRGRAELRLADRAALWNAKPENRHLPSVLEWANIRLLTRKRDWTEPQRKMMNRAGRWHGLQALGLLFLLSAAVAGGLVLQHRVNEDRQSTRASGFVQRVLDADTAQVPDIVSAMRDYRRWVDPALRAELERAPDDSRRKLHAALALWPVDRSVGPFLEQRLLAAAPAELAVIRGALRPQRAELTPRLWPVAESLKAGDAALLPPAAALALYDPEGPRWAPVAAKVAQALVTIDPVLLGSWLDALRPVRDKLTASLAEIFRNKARPESERTLATSILADYAADAPGALAELLMVAEPKAFRTLFPVTQRQANRALPVLQGELAKQVTFHWNESPLDAAWAKPDARLAGRIEAGRGMIAERFAFCQTMPLDEFLDAAAGLRSSGYRPIRVRPYADGPAVRLAAVWARDGRDWRIASGLSPQEIRRRDEAHRKDSYLPADLAGYVVQGGDGKPANRYAALWVQKAGDDDARLYVAATEDDLADVQKPLADAKLIPRTLHALRESAGKLTYSGVWGNPSPAGVTAEGIHDRFEGNYAESRALRGDQVVIDVALSQAGAARAAQERARAALARAEKSLQAGPDDGAARRARAQARLRLGEPAKSLDDWSALLAKDKDDTDALAHRAIALARLGKNDDARADLDRLEQANAPDHVRLFAALVVAAERGEGFEKVAEETELALKKDGDDGERRYAAGRGFALASAALARKDKTRGQATAARALRLLEEAVRSGDGDFGRMDDDLALDPIRDDPAFVELMKPGHPDRRYAAVWSTQATTESISLDSLNPGEALPRARDLARQGYRPVAWSVARTSPDCEPLAAAVWHRPVVAEEAKDRLAERQARAAVALVRLGQAEAVWPLLRHSADPRLRSFIVNWLNPLGADPKAMVAELDRRDSPTTHHPSPATQTRDAILFHPETSTRRALILALGTFGTEALSPGEREPLFARLLDVYGHDPDAGIHGAAGWTLRQWGQKATVQAADAELSQVKEWGDRRWYVNGQGQTFAVIEGPVEFRMGSPPTEIERAAVNEPPRWVAIPRRYAIADREVTIEQFQRFLKTHTEPRFNLPPDWLNLYSPNPDGPWIGLDWYTSAQYCNWLSEQEGIPKDQWCYQPAAGGYVEGMMIPADALRRTGYRLPTEAEWEYACRSGTITPRSYGATTDLLGQYGWYQANSREHAWSGGSLLPNDLGLFDMLGNIFEWMNDRVGADRPRARRQHVDIVNGSEYIKNKYVRMIRGGAFGVSPAGVRSANRNWFAPTERNVVIGFRPARTY